MDIDRRSHTLRDLGNNSIGLTVGQSEMDPGWEDAPSPLLPDLVVKFVFIFLPPSLARSLTHSDSQW